jgi:hypothetical protein
MSQRPNNLGRKRPNPIVRLVRLVVIVAAGAGGWFGYERYVDAQDNADAVGVEAEAASTPPWPDDLVITEQQRNGPYEAVWGPTNAEPAIRTQFDSGLGRVKFTAIETGNGFEISPSRVFYLRVGEPPQEELDAETRHKLIEESYRKAAPTLPKLLPSDVWSYTELTEDTTSTTAAGAVRRLSFRIRGAAYADAQPALAAQWRSTSPLNPAIGPTIFTVELDAQGQIVLLHAGVAENEMIVRYADLLAAPTFESPLASS